MIEPEKARRVSRGEAQRMRKRRTNELDTVAHRARHVEDGARKGSLCTHAAAVADHDLAAVEHEACALPADRRQYQLSLTAKGRAAFAKLERTSQNHVGLMLGALGSEDRKRLLSAMELIERLLGAPHHALPPAILRDPRPGDMGYVVQSHGAVYASEYGFDASFEALVAEIAAKFITSFDAARERCWIADIDGRPVGSVFLVRGNDEVAKLRLLLVEPSARGQGLGQRLVAECVSFARACGYRRITLWTQSILIAARKIYQDAGFALVKAEPHRSFGQNLIGETWEREL